MEEEKNFKLIPLKKWGVETGKFVKCSPQHHNILIKYDWRMCGDYVVTNNYMNKKISMHKFVITILELKIVPSGYLIDHKDVKDPNNKLNNTLDNLRIITYAQNSTNMKKREKSSSKLFGVQKENGKYRVRFNVNGKNINLGCYIDEKEAGIVHDAYIVQNNLDCYPLNFGDDLDFLKNYKIPFKKLKSSIYKGVTKVDGDFFWVRIKVNKKIVFTYRSKNEIECAKEYDKYIVNNNLDKKLNFPDDYLDYVIKKVEKNIIEIHDDFIKILHNNKETYISKESYDKIKYYKVSIKKNNRVHVKIEGKLYILPRYLMDEYDPDILIDHEDNDPLNNRLTNLRRTNHEGNSQNTKKRKTENSTNYVNVIKYGTKFKTQIKNSTFKYTKIWNTEEYAARDRDLQYLKRLPNSLYKIYFAEDWKIPGEIERWSKILY